MARKRLTAEEIKSALAQLSGWEVKNGKLHKTFRFDSFAEAIGWMVSVGIHADKADHHPEWSNVYDKVEVNLVTHDLDNSISNLDVELAQRMEALAE